MAVQQLPTGLEPLINAFAQFATAGTEALYADQIRQREIQDNPEMMQQLARQTRAAQKAGTLDQLASSIRLDSSFLQEAAAAYQPGTEELAEIRSVELGLPQAAAETQFITTLLEGQQGEEAMAANLPFLEAAATASGANFEVLENGFNTDVLSFQMEAGIPQLQVNVEAANLRLQANNINLQEATLTRYQEILDSDDVSDHIKQMAAFALVNPTLASHIQFHENMTFEASMRKLVGAGGANPVDQFEVWLDLRGAINDATDRIQEAEASGEHDQEEAAALDLQTLNSMAERLTNAGLIPPLATTTAAVKVGGIFGGQRIVELLKAIPMSERVRDITGLIAAGQAGVGDLFAPREELGGKSYAQVLDPTEMQQLQQALGVLSAPPPEEEKQDGAGQAETIGFMDRLFGNLSPAAATMLGAGPGGAAAAGMGAASLERAQEKRRRALKAVGRGGN